MQYNEHPGLSAVYSLVVLLEGDENWDSEFKCP